MIIIFMVMLIKTRLAWSLEENVAGTENYSKSHHLNLGTFFFLLVLAIFQVKDCANCILEIIYSQSLSITSEYFFSWPQVPHFQQGLKDNRPVFPRLESIIYIKRKLISKEIAVSSMRPMLPLLWLFSSFLK